MLSFAVGLLLVQINMFLFTKFSTDWLLKFDYTQIESFDKTKGDR